MIHSFLMLGQSNMAGRGFIKEVQPIYNERIQMLSNGRWQMMTEPINYDRPVAGVGLAASFAEAWCEKNKEDQIGLIPCAEGGSIIDEWHPDGILFRHAISQAKFAMENSQLTGILWHQGESDSTPERFPDYYEKLVHVIKAFRTELNAPNLPLMIGGMPDFLGKSGFGISCTKHHAVDQALQKVAFEQEYCYFVTAAELTANPDGIHINALSQRRFGLRYFEAFDNSRHVMEPLEGEEKRLGNLSKRAYTQGEKIYLASMEMALGTISYPEFEAKLGNLFRK